MEHRHRPAAGGLPQQNDSHAIDCALAAIEIRNFMQQMADLKAMQGLPYWELRIGINTGPVVAGVIGQKKLAYDVWGSTLHSDFATDSTGRVPNERFKEIYDKMSRASKV